MITGTSYFPTKRAANAYYRPYGWEAAEVTRKLADGEIHIGKPPLKPHEKLLLIDGGLRYAIASPETTGSVTPNRFHFDKEG